MEIAIIISLTVIVASFAALGYRLSKDTTIRAKMEKETLLLIDEVLDKASRRKGNEASEIKTHYTLAELDSDEAINECLENGLKAFENDSKL